MEDDREAEQGDRDGSEAGDVHEHAQQEHEHPHVLGEVDDGHQGMADLHHEVALLALGGVACLVTGDGDAGDRTTLAVIAREVEVVVAGVVVVGEVARDAADAHALAAVGVEHAARHLLAGLAVRWDARPLLIGRIDVALGDEAQDHGNEDEGDVGGGVAKAVVSRIEHASISLTSEPMPGGDGGHMAAEHHPGVEPVLRLYPNPRRETRAAPIPHGRMDAPLPGASAPPRNPRRT